MKKELTTKQQLTKSLCTNHSGKMAGMISWSSSVLENTYCQQRRAAAEKAYRIAVHAGKDPVDIICRHCYAENLLEYRATARDKYKRNTELLTARVYDLDELPIVNAAIARIEAFGDVQQGEPGIIQATNYMNWCHVNPQTMFGCWTKNLKEYDAAIKTVGKPENVVMIYSIPAINAAGIDDLDAFLDALQQVYPWLDKLFVVYNYDRDDINCGARECLTCRRCYSHSTARIIREKLK